MPVDLQGLRVLVVEDEYLLAMLIEEMCADLGCEVVGPFATFDSALEGSRRTDFDVALVDLNLAGVSAAPVVSELLERSVPVAIASGAVSDSSIGGVQVILSKPYGAAQFSAALTTLKAQMGQGR